MPVQRWRGFDQIPPGWGRCVLTIGVFDGMHRGHQALVRAAVARGKELQLPVVLMTFDPHPSEVVRPGSHPAQLTTLRRRAELADELGVDVFFVLPFSPAMQQTPPETFVHDLLVDRLHMAAVLVGENFRFGHKGAGNLELLRRLGSRFGFTAEGIGLVVEQEPAADNDAVSTPGAPDGAVATEPQAEQRSAPRAEHPAAPRAEHPTEPPELPITSTYVRANVDAGDVTAAAAALGRPHRLEGVVVHGEGRGGASLGYPTANLHTAEHAAIPGDGVYAGWFVLGSKRYPTAISVGSNPTFSGTARTVEAFVLDESANYYGRRVALEFVAKLRDQIAFDSVEALIDQIGKDVDRTRQILGVPASVVKPSTDRAPEPGERAAGGEPAGRSSGTPSGPSQSGPSPS
nr:bifunctional riboflavin kinase/FMN adenylyltransferase [Nakamurella aerolata]